MKTNLTHLQGCPKGLALATAGLLGLMVIAGLNRAVGVCAENQTEVVNAEHEAAVTVRLQQIARIDHFVRMISKGNAEEVKSSLSLELAEDLADMRASVNQDNGDARVFAEDFCNLILKNEKAHPEQYLTAQPEAQLAERKAWETAGTQEVKPAHPSGHSQPMGLAENN